MRALQPLTVTPFENDGDGEWQTIATIIEQHILPRLIRYGSRSFFAPAPLLGVPLRFLPLIDGFKVWCPRRPRLPEFIYLLSGQRFLWLNGRWLGLVAGQGAFVPEQVEYYPFGAVGEQPAPCDSISLIVHPEGGIVVRTRLTEQAYQRSVHFFVPDPVLMQRSVAWWQRLPARTADTVIVEMFERLVRTQPVGLALIARHAAQAKSFPFALRRAMNFCHRAYNIPITVTQMSRHSFVSERQLYRLFKQWLGLSPYDYLSNLRMQIAQEFLMRTRLGVADIAFLVGYTSRSMFFLNFRRMFGFFPTALRYRKAHVLNPFTAPMKLTRA